VGDPKIQGQQRFVIMNSMKTSYSYLYIVLYKVSSSTH